MYSCTSLFLYPLIPGISSARRTTDLSYSCLSLIRFPPCATTISYQTKVFFLCTFPQLPFTPGPTAVCLLRLSKYCKYGRVAPVVVAVEESILWINHPDRKGLAGVRKGLGHWTFSRAVFTPVPTSKSIHPSIHQNWTIYALGDAILTMSTLLKTILTLLTMSTMLTKLIFHYTILWYCWGLYCDTVEVIW